jgi:uncharacterized protein (TIGR03000 family)
MRRSWIRNLGGVALVAAFAFTFVPGAQAQRIMGRGGVFGGYQTGGFYGSPYSGLNQGFGFGNYPGGFANYTYGNLGYYPGNPAYGNYQAPSYYGNYQMPNRYGQPMYGSASQAQGYYNPSMSSGTYYPPNMNTLTGVVGQPPAYQQTTSPDTALITIRLPADAKLMVDDAQTNETGPVRQFVTPGALEKGKTYHYNLKAEWNENGQPVTRERKVDFQAGSQLVVDFMQPTDQTGTRTTTTESLYGPTPTTALITVRLPADARLIVDDLPTTQTGPVRQFVTPGALESGKTYHYTLKAEWVDNGQPVKRERKVDFQAGGQVNVDFMSGSEQ